LKLDSAIIRAIRVAALAGGVGGDTSAVNYLGSIVSSSLVKKVASDYVVKLVSEGCSEMQAALTILPKELGQIIPARNTSDKDASSKSLLDGIKNKVLSFRDSVIQVCSVKTGLANQGWSNINNEIYVQNREGLIKLAENLEQKLVENLNSRGLSTLARYVRVEQ
jgi:hypothetical protein